LLKNNKLNSTESELSKSETRKGLLGADIATNQTKQTTLKFLREKSSEATTEEEKHHQIHHGSNQAAKIKQRVPRSQTEQNFH
jgi:hypothetical protein